MSRRGWLLFVAMGVIWGLPYLLIKIAVREVPAPMLVEMRTGGAALVLLPVALYRGELRPVLARYKALVALAVTEMAVPWLFLFDAERKLSSSLSGLLVAAVPLVGAILARVTGSDRLDRRRLAGVLVGFGGVGALVGFDVGGSDALAAASIAVVAVGYAVGPWIFSRYFSDLPALGVVAGALTICTLLYAPAIPFSIPTRPLAPSVVGSVVGLTLVCTALAFVLFFALIAEAGPVRSTVITYVNPAVAVLLGVSVLGEHVGAATVLGFVLIVAGCVLATARNAAEVPGAPAPSLLVEADSAREAGGPI